MCSAVVSARCSSERFHFCGLHCITSFLPGTRQQSKNSTFGLRRPHNELRGGRVCEECGSGPGESDQRRIWRRHFGTLGLVAVGVAIGVALGIGVVDGSSGGGSSSSGGVDRPPSSLELSGGPGPVSVFRPAAGSDANGGVKGGDGFGGGGLRQTYFVVESYGLVTDAAAEVFTRYARQLEGVAEVWLNYDETCRKVVPGEAYKGHATTQCDGDAEMQSNLARLLALEAAEPNLHVSFFSDGTLERKYPMMRSLQDSVFEGQEPVYDVPYLGLTMWLRNLIDGNGWTDVEAATSMMGNIYVAEGDVLFTGDISKFVGGTEHLQGDLDFLTTKVHNQTETKGFRHVHKNTWPLPPGKLLSAEQFVYRLSPRLLLTIEDRLSMNIVNYGEMLAVTTCDTSFWCSWDVFKLSQHATQVRGPTCTLSWECRIQWDRWLAIQADPAGQNLFYHSCKFLTDPQYRGVFAVLDGAGGESAAEETASEAAGERTGGGGGGTPALPRQGGSGDDGIGGGDGGVEVPQASPHG